MVVNIMHNYIEYYYSPKHTTKFNRENEPDKNKWDKTLNHNFSLQQ